MGLDAKVSALNNMGQVYRDAGDHGAAQRSFLAAMDLNPSDSASLANLLQVMTRLQPDPDPDPVSKPNLNPIPS